MHKLKVLSLILFSATGLFFNAQAQKTTVKTNIPYWFTTTPNVGLEFSLNDKMSLEFSAGVNPFKLADTKQLKHWVIWPELRYWTHETFNGHFFGLHGVAGQYNVSGLKLPTSRFAGLKDHRYKGNAIGLGLSYGYQWILNNRWGIELTLGVGFARFNYDVYSLGKNGQKVGENKKNYFGPTKGAVSLIYAL